LNTGFVITSYQDIAVPDQVIYEYPLNERFRTFLRLELLFKNTEFHMPQTSVWASRAALKSLLDILLIFSRTDLKTELIKELERHNKTLGRIKNKRGVDLKRLGQVLDELESLGERLYNMRGQIGQALRDNEFLKGVLNRSSIPGGDCSFDMPMFHYWLQRPHPVRQQDLERWLQEFSLVRETIALLLSLVRGSNQDSHETANQGFFQKGLDTDAPVQLIRVSVNADFPCYPEISGGKHRFTIRFLVPSEEERPAQTEQDVSFTLSRCII
jgi:cell division protein ZapD